MLHENPYWYGVFYSIPFDYFSQRWDLMIQSLSRIYRPQKWTWNLSRVLPAIAVSGQCTIKWIAFKLPSFHTLSIERGGTRLEKIDIKRETRARRMLFTPPASDLHLTTFTTRNWSYMWDLKMDQYKNCFRFAKGSERNTKRTVGSLIIGKWILATNHLIFIQIRRIVLILGRCAPVFQHEV